MNYPIDGKLDLLKGVYNRIQKDYGITIKRVSAYPLMWMPGRFRIRHFFYLGCCYYWCIYRNAALPLGEYDMAHYAYEIERKDLKLAGGKQDQYAATFGGVNYMEFYEDDKVIVNPLRIKQQYLFELENNLFLYYTSTSRESAKIIKKQSKNVEDKKESSIEAMHQLKEQAR